ncbi:M15 family metallopeptidase [Flavobacterium sp. ABG]|jgi:peptidoglycan L-alanyl-D-glutamate endopeptidase CwlK|uniref:M15 family metallopeptidase n=1 Tax=Flavobacterium sp. ABG TaxID=1423322 RepID=UPI00064AB7AF|nr:M15 family metallopeptidase [Flavobacterium sp. ABG]KLT68371.1 peptidoglycan L-alanyl-D-glutamate endopeptidase [Flavobacterium sp. ABG]
MDQTTKKHIDLLHPTVREEVTKIIAECDLALTGKAKVRITQGLRTFSEQDDLYAFGRTKPGKKVTNAKGGQSIHNFGFAVDICLIIDGKVASWDTAKDWDNDQISDWQECVKIFAKYNWNWGGDWKTFKDLPHFDKKGCGDWKQLSKLKRDKKNYVILYK